MPHPSPLNTLASFDTFGDLLKYLRRRARLSQRDLSIAVGYSESQISRLENNLRVPDGSTLVALFAPALNLENEPAALARLMELAALARGEDPRGALASGSSSRHVASAARSASEDGLAPAGNLPLPVDSFIGREQETTAVKRLLSGSPSAGARLVTLTGAGGSGKTRLALQVARALQPAFPDGAWLVELAAVSNPATVPSAVAAALDIREEPGRSLPTTVISWLRAKHLLLLLDNCEHVIEASARLAESLLAACPTLKILATSREALAIAGEASFQVPTLSLPPSGQSSAADLLAQSEAARLFAERAMAALPGFSVTDQNAPAVTQVCRQLDGIPLALELAAVRIKLLSVAQIAARLAAHDHFRLLTSGTRTARPRHQTLSALIDWSYDLLPEPERVLLRRLSVFQGGWTVPAAEALAAVRLTPPATSPASVLDLLAQLVSKSLVVVERGHSGEMRYRLLEPIREYAWDKLLEAGEANHVRARHLEYFLDLAETVEPRLRGPDRPACLAQLNADLENFWAALDYSQTDGADSEQGLRLAVALAWFWSPDRRATEAHAWLEAALARRGEADRSLLRAHALVVTGLLVPDTGDLSRGRAQVAAAIEIYREAGSAGRLGLAYALLWHGNLAHYQGDFGPKLVAVEESVDLFRALGDQWGLAFALFTLAGTRDPLVNYRPRGERGEPPPLPLLPPAARNDHTDECALYEESLALYRELGDRQAQGFVLMNLSHALFCWGNRVRGRAQVEECLAIGREFGDTAHIALCHLAAGDDELAQDDLDRAISLYQASLALYENMKFEGAAIQAQARLGEATRRRGDYATAASLLARCLAWYQQFGNRENIAAVLDGQARLALSQGEAASAQSLQHQVLAMRRPSGHPIHLAFSFQALAALAAARQQTTRAARLFGAAAPYQAAFYHWSTLLPVWRAEHERAVAAVKAQLGAAALAQLWAEGEAMSLDQALAYAVDEQALA